jgi:hypothetical protein
MTSSGNLEQAIHELELAAQRETKDLHDKETDLRKREEENLQFTRDVQVLQRQLDEKKKKIRENDSLIPKLKSDVNHIKSEQGKKHGELERIKREYTENLHKAGVKGVRLY